MKSIKSIKGLISLLPLLLILSTCSPYVKYLENQSFQTLDSKDTTTKKLYCENSPHLNIIHNSNFTQIEFTKILEGLTDIENYTITELGILFYFYQMNVRPDATDHNSRVQVLVRSKGELFYRDFLSQTESNLNNSIKTFRHSGLIKKDIIQLLLDKKRTFPKKFTIQEQLNSYLDTQKSNSHFLNQFENSFFRIGKPLQKGESYTSPIKLNISKEGKIVPSPPLFPLNKEIKNDSKTKCNFDSNLYQKGIFLINNEKVHSNLFGLLRKNGDSIFFITNKTNEKSSSKPTQGFGGRATQSNVSLCFHKSKNITLDLIGFNSRDSGQILYHLFNYGIYNSQKISDVIEYLIFPRHQFLTNPARLTYESKKGTSEQLTYFLSFDFPVYHVENLAVVYALFESKNKRTFIGDPRINTIQSCNK